MSLKKISITLDSGILGLQKYGGISNYWNRLVENMSSHPDFEATLLLPTTIINNDYDGSLAAKMDCSRDEMHQTLARYMSGYVKSNCDIFHTSYYRLPSSSSCKYVVTVYDFIYERYRKGPSRWLHSFQKKRALKRADAVICISDSTRQDTLHFCPSLDPGKVHVAHLGVDHNKFYHEIKDTVLFVGQRGGHKRFDIAVRAVQETKNLRLSIVGPLLDNEELEGLNLMLQDRWVFFGPVNGSRLREIYSSVYCSIYPSDYEGFGLPILEAMACGCPVVAANNSSLPEVGGAAALYAEEQNSRDYAAQIGQVELIRDELILQGLAHAKTFTWDKTFCDTARIYLNTLSKTMSEFDR
jgi:mannosyltransferase